MPKKEKDMIGKYRDQPYSTRDRPTRNRRTPQQATEEREQQQQAEMAKRERRLTRSGLATHEDFGALPRALSRVPKDSLQLRGGGQHGGCIPSSTPATDDGLSKR